jgi:hypothetical protein
MELIFQAYDGNGNRLEDRHPDFNGRAVSSHVDNVGLQIQPGQTNSGEVMLWNYHDTIYKVASFRVRYDKIEATEPKESERESVVGRKAGPLTTPQVWKVAVADALREDNLPEMADQLLKGVRWGFRCDKDILFKHTGKPDGVSKVGDNVTLTWNLPEGTVVATCVRALYENGGVSTTNVDWTTVQPRARKGGPTTVEEWEKAAEDVMREDGYKGAKGFLYCNVATLFKHVGRPDSIREVGDKVTLEWRLRGNTITVTCDRTQYGLQGIIMGVEIDVR